MMMTVTDAHLFCIASIIVFVFFLKTNVLHINKLLEYTYLGCDSCGSVLMI